MTFRDGLALSALLAAAACAGPKASGAKGPDAFSTLKFAEGSAKPADTPPGASNAFVVEISLERADGSRFAAPHLVAWPGQVATMAVGEDIEYVPPPTPPDVKIDVARAPEPSPRQLHDGLAVDLSAQRAADGGVTFGYRVALAKVTREAGESPAAADAGRTVATAVADVTEVDVQGTRWIEPGAQTMLARLASPDGSGPMLILARVTPVVLDALPPTPAAEAVADREFARPMSGHTVHLRVSAVRVTRDFPPGFVLDETAASDVLKTAGGEILRDFEAYTCLDGRVRLAASTGAPDGKSPSFAATAADDGRVTIAWNGRTACVRASPGRRFVAVAPVDGGGTAGVIVSVNADE
jgi:hypothetical protein